MTVPLLGLPQHEEGGEMGANVPASSHPDWPPMLHTSLVWPLTAKLSTRIDFIDNKRESINMVFGAKNSGSGEIPMAAALIQKVPQAMIVVAFL